MIRAAAFVDIPAMRAVLRGAYERSRYAADGSCGFDAEEATRLLGHAIGQAVHGQAFAEVSETDGEVRGLLVGVLSRVYGIGTKCWASDLFWVASPNVDKRDPGRLMRRFERWARAHPDVIEIVNGTTNVMADPDGAGKILEALGFERRGNLYRKEVRS